VRYFLLLLCLLSTSLFALVSIAPVDIGSKPGLSGNISGSLNSKSGNTQKDEYSLGMRLQYDEGVDYLTWGEFTYDYGESKGTKNEDKTYAHLRYIHTLTPNGDWSWELFLQSEQDRFKDINGRSLAGVGIRWRFLNSDDFGKGYTGIGRFVEKIDYSHSERNANEENHRMNSYIAYSKSFVSGSKMNYIGYYQPKFGNVSDYVSSQSAELILPIAGQFNLNVSAKYLYDSRPTVGVEKRDTVYMTSLFWQFEKVAIMKILVDADAFPNALKEILLRAVLKRQITTTIFIANKRIGIPDVAYVSMEVVAQGP
jgi:hypothetical protein